MESPPVDTAARGLPPILDACAVAFRGAVALRAAVALRGAVALRTAVAPRGAVALRRATALCAAALLLAAWPVAAADMGKTLRVDFRVAETGFDPQALSDNYSAQVSNSIFDPPYDYDYFASPPKLIPNTAAALPQITDGGRTYTVRIRPGIYFTPDAAFKGVRRELTAADYVYSIKRVFDPKVRSYWLYIFDGNLLGLAAALANARASGSFDYDAPLEGVQLVDRYTFRLRFRDPDFAIQHWMTTNVFAAVAREVVEAYRDPSNRVMENPVGTGPYRLKSWTRGQKIVLEANAGYRDEKFPTPGSGASAADQAIGRQNAGKQVPIVGTVEISIIEEPQPRLLTFERGDLDYTELPASLAGTVLDGDRLKAQFAQRGVRLLRQVDPSLTFTFFNMDDPVVGGYGNDRIALRRAIGLGYDRDSAIRLLANGQAIAATQPVPPPVPGYDPSLAGRKTYDPVAARALLDKFGYTDRDGDGYREMPDGTPLTIQRASTPDTESRASDELWKRSMDAIGIRMTNFKQKWPELNRMAEAGQLQMWGLGWITTIPDGDSFFAALASTNIGKQNDARFRHAEYDRLYAESRKLPDGPARAALYRRMTEIVLNLAPWLLQMYPFDNVLVQPWVLGFRLHPFLRNQWKYYDLGPRS